MNGDRAKSPAPGSPSGAVVAEILARVEERLEAMGERLVASYRREIVDYRALGEQTLAGDIVHTAIGNVEELLEDLRHDTVIDDARLERFRNSAVRRAHQGVSFGALLHAYRLWGKVVWEELLAVTDQADSAEREAALWMAGRVMSHVNAVSNAVAEAYLDEAAGVWSDREVVRRDLLETLISGRASEHARQRAAALRLDLAENHMVVVARHVDAASAGRAALRDALALAKRHLRPDEGSLLVGLREDEVVAIYPISQLAQASAVERQARDFAADLGDFAVGIGRWHAGVEGIASSYDEAHEALEIAFATGARSRAVAFADVLLDHIIRTSPHSEALLEDTLGPVREYDEARQTELMATLREYFANGFNLTRSATALHVHPNTVVYRLQRIKALTGRDPGEPEDLLLLVLSLKLLDLGRAAGGAP